MADRLELEGFHRIMPPFAVFGIVARRGFVVESAPIGKWMIGKPLNAVRVWVIGKRSTIEDRRRSLYYVGNKRRIAKPISAYLESIRAGREFWEPFCGGLGITAVMSGPRVASDISEPLITLYKALQQGWDPPEVLTREEYAQLKKRQDPYDPLTAFAGFGCSFGGKWFGGYGVRRGCWAKEVDGDRVEERWFDGYIHRDDWIAKDPIRRFKITEDREPPVERQPAAYARRTLLEDIANCHEVLFEHVDYRDPRPVNLLIYADPPYEGTTKYATDFDHAEFWAWCRRQSEQNTVIISEYAAPTDFRCVLEIPLMSHLSGHAAMPSARTERLFVYNP